MAQFYSDFSDDTVGAFPGYLVWALQDDDEPPFEVVSSNPYDGSEALLWDEESEAGLHWEDTDDTSDHEIFVSLGVDGFTSNATDTSVTTRFSGSGDFGDQFGYMVFSENGDSLELRRRNGSSTNGISDADVPLDLDEIYHIRFRANGTELKTKAWQQGESEPTSWVVEGTDSNHDTGWPGMWFRGSDLVYITEFGVGTDGDSAPTEPVSAAVDGDVFAHDTDAASTTGVRTRGASIASIDVDASAVTGVRAREASISSIDVDLSTVAGETTAVGPWESLEDLDPARARFGAAGLSGLVHVIGGANASTFSATDLVQEYNPDTDTWSAGTTLPRDMDNAAAVSDGTSIFFVGGDPNFTSPHTHVMEFDGTSWSDFEPLPTARASVGLAANSEYIVVGCGQDDDDHYDDIDIYDRAADEWINTTHPGGVRDNLGVAIDGGVVYFGGGGNDSGGQDDFYRYDIDADSTTQLADLPLGDRLSSMTFVNGTIFCTITNGDAPLPVYSVAHDEWHQSDDDPPDVGDGGGTYYDGYVYTGGGFSGGEVFERLEQAVPAAHTNLEATYHE